jgi:hypothetical protein
VGSTVGYLVPTLFQYSTSASSDGRLALVPGPAGGYLLMYAGSL